MATIAERVSLLRHQGFDIIEIGGILNISLEEVAACDLNPAAPDSLDGSVDLSAVDQDITVLNSHKVTAKGAPATAQAVASWFDPDYWMLYVQATPETQETDLIVLAPEATPDVGASLRLAAGYDGDPQVEFKKDGATGSLSLSAHHRLATGDDLLFSSGRGPMLVSPNGDRHRLKVADDGTLSTESVA